MLPPCSYTSFMIAPRPSGWVQHGERWGLWWGSREVASVQPDASGIRVVLSCRKLWEDKTVRANSVRQGKRYAERWCAARILEGVPLREAVARLVVADKAEAEVDSRPRITTAERQQERRLAAALPPLAIPR